MYSNVLNAGSVNFIYLSRSVHMTSTSASFILHMHVRSCDFNSTCTSHPVRLVKWLVPGWTTVSCGHGMTLHQTCHGTSHGSSDPCWWPLQFFPCLFNAACAANTGWGGASAETERSASRNRKVVQPHTISPGSSSPWGGRVIGK